MKLTLSDREKETRHNPEIRYVAFLETEAGEAEEYKKFYHGAPSETKALAYYRLLYVVLQLAPHSCHTLSLIHPILEAIKKEEALAGKRWPPPWGHISMYLKE